PGGAAQVSFTFGQTLPLPCAASSLAAADINGDGTVDLVSGNSCGSVSVFGNGGGTFTPLGTTPVAAGPCLAVIGDFTGDGKPDLAVAATTAGTVTGLLNLGAGKFQASMPFPAGPTPYGIVAADFNQ